MVYLTAPGVANPLDGLLKLKSTIRLLTPSYAKGVVKVNVTSPVVLIVWFAWYTVVQPVLSHEGTA